MAFTLLIRGYCDVHSHLYQTLFNYLPEIKASISHKYNTSFGAFYAPQDTAARAIIKKTVSDFKNLEPTLIMLVGIGGSNMGALAILHALKGSLLFSQTSLKFYCADTIDNAYTQTLLTIFEEEITKGGTVLVCVVTKSGTTTETIINTAFFVDLLKRHYPSNYQKYLIYITDAQSPLMSLAINHKIPFLEIPASVGGRFSIFTAVGLFPLGLFGIDTDEFCRGAHEMLEVSLQEDVEMNTALRSAAALYAHYEKGFVIHDIFPFSPDLLSLAHWYKQLIGESLGKKYDLEGILIEAGISPTVSVGTIDLHSVVQLYLAGPRNRITTFITQNGELGTLIIPYNECANILPGLAGRSVTSVKHAIFKGVVAAYEMEKRPYMILDLPGADEVTRSYGLGAIMMMKMMETIFVAKLFNSNPFDQPAVELYKAQTRKFLAQK